MRGTFSRVTGCSVSRAPEMIGSAAFLLPEGRIVPERVCPPSTTNCRAVINRLWRPRSACEDRASMKARACEGCKACEACGRCRSACCLFLALASHPAYDAIMTSAQVTAAATTVIALALVALGVIALLAALDARKTSRKINALVGRLHGDLAPAIRYATSIVDNINYITRSLRHDVRLINRTVSSAN